MRPNKTHYYLKIAKAIAERSPCSRRQFGAILVKNDAILSTGYNGSVRGTTNCGEEISCLKDLHQEEHYISYSKCPAVHAETNAIINAARNGISVLGATLYLSPLKDKDGDRPCFICRRFCIQAGIKDCFYISKDGTVVQENIDLWISLENKWMDEVYKEGKTRNPV